MLAKPKPKEENPNDEPPDPSQRFVDSSVVPIQAANSDIIEATRYTPPKARGPVVVPMRFDRKNRADFDSDVDWELYQQFQELNAKVKRQTVEDLNEVRSLVEELELDPPTPLVGASASPRDERGRLEAYLAHHNPSGAGRIIKTVRNTVMVDGQPYSAPKRQDRITTKEGVEEVTYCRLYRPRPKVEVRFNDDGKEIGRKILAWQTGSVEVDYKTVKRKYKRSEWNEYKYDGLTFELSGDLERDRQICERRTRKSQQTRSKLGQPKQTKHLNLVTVPEYSPRPTVQFLVHYQLRHGKPYSGDVFDMSYGIVDDSAGAFNAEMENNYIYHQKFGDPAQEAADPLLGMSTDSDDLPWSYSDSDEKCANFAHPHQYDEPIGPELPLNLKPSYDKATRLAREEQIGTQLKHIPYAGTGIVRSNTEEEVQEPPVSEDSEPETICYVAPDGSSLPIKMSTADVELQNAMAMLVSKQEQLPKGTVLETNINDEMALNLLKVVIKMADNRISKVLDELDAAYADRDRLVKMKLIHEARMKSYAKEEEPASINSKRTRGKPSAALRRYLQIRDGQEGLQRERHREIVKRARYAQRMRSLKRQAEIRRRREIRSAKLKTISAEVQALNRIGLRQRSLGHLRLHKQNLLAEFERDQVARRKADVYREQCFLRRVGNYKTSLKKRAKMAWLRFKTQQSRRNAQDLLSSVRLESEPPSNVTPLPARIPPVVESVRHESNLILPETKEIIFDSVTEMLMTNHMKKLIKSGVVSHDELEAANQVFRQRAWQKFSKHHTLVA